MRALLVTESGMDGFGGGVVTALAERASVKIVPTQYTCMNFEEVIKMNNSIWMKFQCKPKTNIFLYSSENGY